MSVTPAVVNDIRTMNLIQLQDRLTAIIAENVRRGRADQNLCPVTVRLQDDPASGELVDHDQWFPISFVSSGLMGLPEGHIIEMIAYKQAELGASIHKGRRRRRRS